MLELIKTIWDICITWIVATGVSDPLTAAANCLSVLGFLGTIAALIGIRSLKNHYLTYARVPEHAQDLRALASELIKLVDNVEDNIVQIGVVLATIEASLTSLSEKLDRKTRQAAEINELEKLVRNCRDSSKPDTDLLRKVHSDIYKLAELLKERWKDLQWEKTK